MKVVVPIRPHTFSEFKTLVQRINGRADMIEVWLDQVKDGFLKDFKQSSPDCELVEFLGVCKMPDERGNFAGTQIERIKILQKFLEAGGSLVDLDVTRNAEELIRLLPAKKLILSFHDFETVPKNLEDIFARMQKFSPKIYKFAVTTNTQTELKKFLAFVKNFPKKYDAIFTTMGTLGTRGREQIEKLNASWGIFSALDKDHKTAEGQKTLDDFSSPPLQGARNKGRELKK